MFMEFSKLGSPFNLLHMHSRAVVNRLCGRCLVRFGVCNTQKCCVKCSNSEGLMCEMYMKYWFKYRA